MFTKDPGLKALANIKSSERRKLVSDITKTYSVPEHLTTLLVPSSIQKATYKSPLGHSGTLYTDEEHVPAYFKSRDSDFIPTVYTLWSNPTLLPIVYTNSYVIKKLENGADLMLPGTIPPFDKRCTKGTLVAIASYEAPSVVRAVGTCRLNLTQFEETAGRSGVAVNILHFNGDELAHVSKKTPPVPSNEEVYEKFKVADAAAGGTEAQEKAASNDDSHLTEVLKELQLEDDVHESSAVAKNKSQDGEQHDEKEQHDKKEHADIEESQVPEEAEPESTNNEPEEVATLQTSDIDYLFKRAFLLTLYQNEIQPPVSASNFMSNHLLKNLPSVSESLEHLLTIKKTSWKKSAKFFKEMEKAKYLKLKGKDDSLTILEVANKDNNEEIRNFVPHRVKKSTSGSGSNGAGSSQSTSQVGNKNADGGKLNVNILYKPNSKIRPFFDKLGEAYNKYYNAKQVTELLNKYITKFDLVNPRNKRTVVLDDFLNDLINTGNKEQTGRVFPRDKISTGFLKHFTQYYKALKGNESIDDIDLTESPPLRGTVPKIKIISEMKLGRKMITRTSNFENFNIVTADELSQYLKVKCSGSTTIGKCKENPKLDEVTVQGPHIPTVAKFFTDRGVSPSYIETIDRLKSKKKH